MKFSCDSSVMYKLVALSVLVLILACSGSEGAKGKKSSGKSLERIDTVEEIELAPKNGTSFMARLSKFISPRVIEELTSSFNTYGLPATIAVGAGAIILLPIYLAAALVGWVPLRNILYPANPEPDYSSYYKHSPVMTYYETESSPATKYGYPSQPSPSPMYGYAEAPAMAPMYGYPAPAPTPAPGYGYPPAPAPAPTPAPQYGYPPAPAPSPAPQYGYPAAPSPSYGYMTPAPSPSYGYQSNDPAPSTSYGYSQADPAPVYGYPAIMSAPAPASQYGSPKSSSSSYGAPEADKTVQAEIKMSARKARSIRLQDGQCAERLACEISKATKGIKLPGWMDKVVDILPWKENEIVKGARKFMTEAKDCSKFICDSYEIWGRMQ